MGGLWGGPELRLVVDARRARRHAVRSRVRARPLHLPHSFAGSVSADIWTAAAESLVFFQVVSGRPKRLKPDEVICGDRDFSGFGSAACATPKVRALSDLVHFRLRKIVMLFARREASSNLFAGSSVFPSWPLLCLHKGRSSDLIYVDDRGVFERWVANVWVTFAPDL